MWEIILWGLLLGDYFPLILPHTHVCTGKLGKYSSIVCIFQGIDTREENYW